MRGGPLIVFALFLDGLQAVITLGLTMTFAAAGMFVPIGGGIVGAVLGCVGGAVVGGAGGAIAAGIGAVPGAIAGCFIGGGGGAAAGGAIGSAAGVALFPMGTLIGFGVDVCLSAAMGAGLIVFLSMNKMFYPKYFLPGGISELTPGISLLPTWTLITAMSLWKKAKEERLAQAQANIQPERQPILEVEAEPRSMDDIRVPSAANDNNLPQAQRYAA